MHVPKGELTDRSDTLQSAWNDQQGLLLENQLWHGFWAVLKSCKSHIGPTECKKYAYNCHQGVTQGHSDRLKKSSRRHFAGIHNDSGGEGPNQRLDYASRTRRAEGQGEKMLNNLTAVVSRQTEWGQRVVPCRRPQQSERWSAKAVSRYTQAADDDEEEEQMKKNTRRRRADKDAEEQAEAPCRHPQQPVRWSARAAAQTWWPP